VEDDSKALIKPLQGAAVAIWVASGGDLGGIRRRSSTGNVMGYFPVAARPSQYRRWD
jgi:hypothetical protein